MENFDGGAAGSWVIEVHGAASTRFGGFLEEAARIDSDHYTFAVVGP